MTSENVTPKWWRTAVAEVQADHETALRLVNKAIDVLYETETLTRGIGGEYWRRAHALIQDGHTLSVALSSLRHDIGEAKPDD